MNPSASEFQPVAPAASGSERDDAVGSRRGRHGRVGRGQGVRGRGRGRGRRTPKDAPKPCIRGASSGHLTGRGPHRETDEPDITGDDSGDHPSCLLCCEPMRVVAYGACNHKVSCEKCLLRLRICYKNYACPMCKQPKNDMVIAPYREGLPDFQEYEEKRHPSSRIIDQLGDGVVYVDKFDHVGRGTADATSTPSGSSGLLLNQVLNMVGRSCAVCQQTRDNRQRLHKTFKSNKALMDHMREHHPHQHLCRVCLDEQRVFPLDQTVYSSLGALKQHKKDAHPICKFCRTTFYDGDGLFYHLIENHFQCQLCQRDSRATDAWFRNAQELQLHLANEHFACEYDVCRGALVAFLTLEELQKHYIDQHSGRVGRWDSQNSRRLDIDFNFTGGTNRGSSHGTSRRVQFERESHGGLEVIDDHDVPAFPSLSGLGRQNGATSAFPSLPTSEFSRMNVQSRSRTRDEEHFPSLGVGSGSSGPSAPPTSATTRRLVSVRVKCDCGRKKSSKVIEEGDPVPRLECDGICRLEGAKEDRKKQLDDAFGIDASSHLSRFARRQVDWGANPKNAPLLQAAKADVGLIKDYEALLEEFLKSSAVRKVLAPAPKKHRMVLHHMAEAYGISSVSMGAEPNRSIQLFKPLAPVGRASSSIATSTNAGLPQQLLSQYITSVTAKEIEALVHANRGYQIRFTDISKTADLQHHIRCNLTDYGIDVDNDAFSLEWEDDLKTSCVASFKNAEHVKAIRNSLQGGIRGVFRVDYL